MRVALLTLYLPLLLATANAGELAEHLDKQARVDVVGMSVLTVFGGLSTVTGAVGWGTSNTVEWRSFHQMNLGWGVINTGLAINGLVGALGRNNDPSNMHEALRVSAKKQTFYAIMVGLDVAYLTAGGFLWSRGEHRADPRSLGYGRSLVLQGAGLLLLDLTMLLAHGHLGKQLWASPTLFPVAGMQFGGRL